VLGALILGDEVVGVIRRELRKLSDGVLVAPEEVAMVLTNEVLKRDVLEGDEAAKAQARVRRFYGKVTRRSREVGAEKPAEPSQEQPKEEVSLSDQLLNQAEQQPEPKPV
jgi:hypothetical protein